MNNTGFGGNTGFGSNNTGFGGGNTSFGNTNTGFGFNNGNTQQTAGLCAGGFNQVTEYVRATPSGHFDTLNGSVAALESKLQAKCPYYGKSEGWDAPRFWSPQQGVVEKKEKEEEEKGEVWQGAHGAVDKMVGVMVEWQGCSQPVSVNARATVKELKQVVQKTFGLTEAISLLHGDRALTDSECVGFLFRDLPYVTAVLGETPAPEPRECYRAQVPSLTDPSYILTPSIESLKGLLNSELACVKDVVIEKPGVGKIAWLEGVDLRGVNLSDVVEITTDEHGASSIAVSAEVVSEE